MKKMLMSSVLAVIAGVAAFTGVSAAVGSDNPPNKPNTPRVATLPVADKLGPGAIAEITRRHGSFTAVATAPAGTVSRATAVERAGGDLGFINDAKSVNAQLGKFTDDRYGKETETDATRPSKIAPTVKDRLVWLVEVKGFTMPAMGPMLPEGTTPADEPVEGGSDGLFVIDALTGELISGDQYSSFAGDNVGD